MRKLLLLGALLAACGAVPSESADVSLQPYFTHTPMTTNTPNVLVVVETFAPTSTPQVYIVQQGDTFSEIAEKFNTSLDALRAANPDVNPNTLPIGQTLLIPDPSTHLAAASTPTPVPAPVTQAVCHPTADSGLWCFALIQNNTSEYLETVSAQVMLLDENNRGIASQTAFPILDVIPPNSSLPVYVHFPNAPADAVPQIQLLSAMQAGASHRLPAMLNNTAAQIDWDGKSALVTGLVVLPAESNAASQVWVAAVAYDENGTVVGVRRWEGEALQPGGSIRFEFVVASLGGVIEAVEFFVQARP
jgi:LysM repeat protein